MNSKPLILGHRGASAIAPENTLVAFRRAMSDGADGTEFDVRLSRDQVPVVIHDANLKRTGLANLRVSELTAQELQRFDVGSWFARGKNGKIPMAAYAGETLPTLPQVFELFAANNGLLYVEMKCDQREGGALAAAVVGLIREWNMRERAVVESFDLSAVAEVKRLDQSIRTAALFEPKLSQPLSILRQQRILSLARECGAEEIALHHTLAKPRLIEKAKADGFEVVVWTVDDGRWIPRAQSLGVKALIANDPAQLVTYRNQPTEGLW